MGVSKKRTRFLVDKTNMHKPELNEWRMNGKADNFTELPIRQKGKKTPCPLNEKCHLFFHLSYKLLYYFRVILVGSL